MRTLKTIFSLAIVKGFLAGLLGAGAGIGLTMLIRLAMKLPAWNQGPVLTIGILIGVITYLAVIGIFNYWFHWATGGQLREESAPPAKNLRIESRTRFSASAYSLCLFILLKLYIFPHFRELLD